jgi:hypothetical protein
VLEDAFKFAEAIVEKFAVAIVEALRDVVRERAESEQWGRNRENSRSQHLVKVGEKTGRDALSILPRYKMIRPGASRNKKARALATAQSNSPLAATWKVRIRNGL